jgi:hypothetical protein
MEAAKTHIPEKRFDIVDTTLAENSGWKTNLQNGANRGP